MKHLFALLGLSLMANAAFATDFAKGEYDWYYSPIIGYAVDDSLRDTGPGHSIGVGIGKHLNEKWAMEFNIPYNRFDEDERLKYTQYGFALDFLRKFDIADDFTPYYLLGLGYLRTDIEENSPTVGTLPDYKDPTASVGLGLMLPTGKRSQIRMEARYRHDFHSGPSFNDVFINLGLSLPMGDVIPEVTDKDGDGVPDGRDQCPNTMTGVMVNSDGCELDGDMDGVVDRLDQCPNSAPGANVDSSGCAKKEALDSDGDGVVDGADKCPKTPAGAKVNSNGCELDDDGDSVVNSKDKCPNTAKGVAVDIKGCEIKGEIKLPGVKFETNSSTLTQDSLQVLNDAAATLVKNPGIIVVAEGHTDSMGDAGYNMRLSQNRAESVLEYLVSKGANADNITAEGFGETKPIGDNSTKEGRQQNRRVSLRVVDGN